jgi:hypothetical protein
MAGVQVFFLNTGHAGDLGPAQAQWFAEEAAAIPPDQQVLIVAHHPSLFGSSAKSVGGFGFRKIA